MEASEIVQILNPIKASFVGNDLIRASKCFFFYDGFVVAWDGIGGGLVPLDLGAEFGIAGEPLVKFLSSHDSCEVEFSVDKDEVSVRCGRSRLKLPNVPLIEASMPDLDVDFDVKIQLEPASVVGINRCSEGMSRDSLFFSRIGVTLSFSKDGGKLYSTDDMTITEFTIEDGPSDSKAAFILPPRMCDIISKLGDDEPLNLGVREDLVTIEVGEYEFFSRLIDSCDPVEYAKVVDILLGGDLEIEEIPNGFAQAIERAVSVGCTVSEIKISDTVLVIHSEGPNCELDDKLDLEDDSGDISLKVTPEYLNRCLPYANGIMFTEKAIILINSDQTLLQMICLKS